jgi:ankyrin repeat protein
MEERRQLDTDDNALVLCAEHGKLEWVKFLIAAGANVHYCTDYALRWASINGHLEIVKELLKAGADVHVHGNLPLANAYQFKHNEIAKFLKDHIAKEKKSKGRTIRESLNEKFVEDSDPITDMGMGLNRIVADSLTSLKNDSRIRGIHLIDNGSVLYLFIYKEMYEFEDRIFNEYFPKGTFKQFKTEDRYQGYVKVYATINEEYRKAFIHAFSTLDIEKFHLFEKFVEDSDPVTDMGIGIRAQISRWMKEKNQEDTDDNALAECAEKGKLEWVKFLIAAGANVHAFDDWALRWASRNGHLEIVKELLKAGADVHAFNDKSLRYASLYGHLEVVRELENHIAKEKKSRRRTVRESLLEKFVEDSDPVSDMGIGIRADISKWMKSIGEKNIEDDDWALDVCADQGKLEWVKFLIDKGANIHNGEDAALRWASRNGHLEIVKELLKAGADVNINNSYPLYWASRKGHLDVVKELLSAGADVHAKSKSRVETALDAAILCSKHDVVKFLKNYIANEKKTKRKAVKESLFEKFVEDSDPVRDMGIGQIAKIKKWLADFKQEFRGSTYINNMTINHETLRIDVEKYDCDISFKELNVLPEYIKFGEISGDFSCCFDNEETIKNNGPKVVGGDYVLFVHSNPNAITKDVVKRHCIVHGEILIKEPFN